jgi:hypothetical protein
MKSSSYGNVTCRSKSAQKTKQRCAAQHSAVQGSASDCLLAQTLAGCARNPTRPGILSGAVRAMYTYLKNADAKGLLRCVIAGDNSREFRAPFLRGSNTSSGTTPAGLAGASVRVPAVAHA